MNDHTFATPTAIAGAVSGTAAPDERAPLAASRDWIIVISAALCGLGLVMVFSAGSVYASRFGSPWHFLGRQALWLAVSAAGLGAVWALDYRCWARWWPLAAAGVLAALAAVLLFGRTWNGARRWISLSGFVLQPSEAAKFGVILAIAGWAARERKMDDFRRRLLPALLFLGAVAGLILVQPDVGTAALVSAVGVMMLIVAGARVRHFLPATAAAVPLVAVFAWWKFDHFRSRIIDFLEGKGHQAEMALTGIGSGGLWGLGPGNGAMTNRFVPEVHTDFILAAIGEELGLVGTLGVVGLFVAFIYHGMRVTNLAGDRLGALIAFGVTITVALQAALNIGVVTRCLPAKGIALPFVSYGGSSLLLFMIGVGLLLNVAGRRLRELK